MLWAPQSPSTTPRFALKSLTRAFLPPSLIYPPAPGGQPGRRALLPARGKLLTTEILLCFPSKASRPRCRQRSPAGSEPSRQPGRGTSPPLARSHRGRTLGTSSLCAPQPRHGKVWSCLLGQSCRRGQDRAPSAAAARGGGPWAAVSRGTGRTARSTAGNKSQEVFKRCLGGSCLQGLVVGAADAGAAPNQARKVAAGKGGSC